MDILKKINLEINEQNKNLYFQDLDFTINTNQGIYIEDGNYHSFTFPISRDSDNDLMENLLLSLQEDGSYKAFLVTYEISEEQRIALESNEELSNDLVISSIQELDDDFSDLFSKIIYQDGCVTMIQYEWHTWDGQTWQFTSGSTCNHLPDDPNGSCQVTYTYDIIDNCTSSAGGGPGSTNTGSSTYSPSGPSGGSTGGQNTTTPTPNCRANCITTLEQSTIVNVTGMEDGSSSYYWLVNMAAQQDINDVYDYIVDNIDNEGNLDQDELTFLILAIQIIMSNSGEVDFENEIIKDSSFIGTKADCVLNELIATGNNVFKTVSEAFTQNNSKFKLRFKVEPNNQGAEAVTPYPSDENGIIDILIAPSSANGNAIDLARIIFHESIHAELHRIQLTGNAGSNPLPQALYDWFMDMWEDYEGMYYNPGSVATAAEHYYMANQHTNNIAGGLREFDEFTHPLETYKGFAWTGLQSYGIQAQYVTQQQLNDYTDLSQIVYTDEHDNPCD